jgi:hypothetical protein
MAVPVEECSDAVEECSDAKISLLKEQIAQCRSDITAYNTQFIASSFLSSVLAAVAAVFCTTSTNEHIWNLFYILPTVYFLSLYNVIKYTNSQLKLGAYQMVLEKQINALISTKFMCWETKAERGFQYTFFGAVVQVFFDVPISIFMFWGFWKLEKSLLWSVLLTFMCIQVLVIIAMAISLCFTKKHYLKLFDYKD